ncbi:putative bifunctional diguanylate cyclase/phosphodiesterase, partial [Anaerosporobacter sp.]
MFFTFLIILACIPFSVGITMLVIFKRSKLAKSIFLFLFFASIWQIDVAFLYADQLFKEETILLFFRIFRFGSIMVTPTILYIGYTIVQELLHDEYKKKWSLFVNGTTVFIGYVLSLYVYIVGWSVYEIKGLELVQYGSNTFYYPINGELAWIYNSNILFFAVNMIICFLISLDIQTKSERSFLIQFIGSTIIGYTIGFFNMFPWSRLLPSSIAILVFAISVLILSSRMHLMIVKNMNKKLSEQKRFLLEVINLNPNYIYAKDEDGRYTLMNQSYAQLMGINIQDTIGKTDDEIKRDVYQDKHISNLSQKEFIREESIISASGEEVWVQTVKVPIHISDSSLLLAVSTDITERKKHEDKIKYQANHDALTGLPNRRMFNKDLTNLLEKAKMESSQNTIMFIDLDRFKYINDTQGHDIGDLLLIEVSKRMEMLIKQEHPCANIYRLGGDEFTILLPHYNVEDSEAFAKGLLKLFKHGFIVDGCEYFITPSIGISVFPNDGDDVNTLIKHADTAMYYVKERGKNNYQLYTSEMHHQFYRKMMIEKQLRTVLDKEELELYYQPIMDMKTHEIIGMESLIRWNSEILGKVTPDEFIPIAEETGMIIPIGQWVLETAIEQTVRWQKEMGKPLRIGINVSVRQISEPSFVEHLKNTIKNIPIEPSNITLEITESIAMYAESMTEKLYELKELGIRVTIDDFGTGYSSLSYLNKYPLDYLKIDKSFVIGMNRKVENQALVKTIIAIAKQLDLKVIAEGVEGEEEYQFLSEIGCDYAQGYFISRPLSETDFKEKFLSEMTNSN